MSHIVMFSIFISNFFNQHTRKYIIRPMVIKLGCLVVLVLDPNFVPFLDKKLQSLSRVRMGFRPRVHYRQLFIVHGQSQMNIIAWMAHQATGNSVDTPIRCGKYPCRRFIGPTNISQHAIILHNSMTAHCCVLGQKSSESNSRSISS